jgi:dTDP-4-amino-4,6-dideoxygalactose transaminase
MNRNELQQALTLEGIATKVYFDPPLHQQRSLGLNSNPRGYRLPHTECAAREVLSLPMYSQLEPDAVDMVVEVIESIHMAATR